MSTILNLRRKVAVKSKFIILLLFLGLVLAGCTGATTTEGQQSGLFGAGSSDNTDVSSKGGVTLRFGEGNPPSEMFKGQDYTFSFVFENEQIHDIADMVVRSYGYDEGFVTGLSPEYNVDTIPRANSISGVGVYASLIVEGVNVDGFTGDYSFDPKFDYCYTATTTFREQVCVPSARNQCDLNYDRSEEQNGPLQVTLNDLQLAGDDLILPLEIRNRGEGEAVNSCFDSDDYQIGYNLVEVKLGSQTGDCRPASSDSYSLVDDRASIFCTFPRTASSEEAYVSQLSVELNYKYQQSTELDVEVKDLERFLN